MWFWERREIIMQIISIALLFAEKNPEERKSNPRRANEEKVLVRPTQKVTIEPKSEKEKREEALDELTEETESLGLYDLGADGSKVGDVSEELQD